MENAKTQDPATTHPADGGDCVDRTVRQYYRGRWLWSMALEAEQWYGCHRLLEDAMEEAFKDARIEGCPSGTPIYFAHGRPMTKQEARDMGVEWPFYEVWSRDAITILLPNVPDDGSPLAFGVPPAREAESAGGMPKVPKAW